MKELQYRKLILKINYRYSKIYVKQFKVHSAFIIQLKTSKIKFNQFLHER